LEFSISTFSERGGPQIAWGTVRTRILNPPTAAAIVRMVDMDKIAQTLVEDMQLPS